MLSEQEFSDYKAEIGKCIDKMLDQWNAAFKQALVERGELKERLQRIASTIERVATLEEMKQSEIQEIYDLAMGRKK